VGFIKNIIFENQAITSCKSKDARSKKNVTEYRSNGVSEYLAVLVPVIDRECIEEGIAFCCVW